VIRPGKTFAALLLTGLLLQSCEDSGPVYHTDTAPQRLSEWGLFDLNQEHLAPHQDTAVFVPANTLFTDYAHKLRGAWIPPGQRISVTAGSLDYPEGTILSKTFYYPTTDTGEFQLAPDTGATAGLSLQRHRLIETRLLVRREQGWDPLVYVWNDEQTEAFRRVAGASLPATLVSDSGGQAFTYFVPNENQCAGCHVKEHPDGGLQPLGAVSHQLATLTSTADGLTALQQWQARGWLNELPDTLPVPRWQDASANLDKRARAYLDMNCGHCHNPRGPADTSALLLDGFAREGVDLGICKGPVAAGGGTGNRRYGITPGAPEDSILLYRLQSTAPDEMMPELGRSLMHAEGVGLIRAWIAALPGRCG
jgi:uncharacterized repeat protein (TIGR03806 family)